MLKKGLIFCLLMTFLLNGVSFEAEAKRKPGLGHSKLKSLISHTVRDLSRSDFMTSIDLADRFVLANISTDPKAFQSDKVVTNLILNQILGYYGYQILNQDLTTDLRVQFSLTDYSSYPLAQARGILLGANYIIHGKLSYNEQLNEKGVMKYYYKLELKISDIRSNEIKAQAKATTRFRTKK